MLYAASRNGNYPLLRVYSGTDDFLRLAEMYVETIHNAWCAIPLFWFNQMDGRGPWDLAGSIQQHQQVMAWYGGRGIPVELNEPHHWGMRDAPDVVCVVSAYLSAYNARAFGVQDYIAQLMFNSPPGLSDAMDLAKMLAILDLIAPLAGDDFRIWRQTRTGLLSYPLDPDCGACPPGNQRVRADGAAPAHRARGGAHRSAPRCHRRRCDRSLQAGAPGDRKRFSRAARLEPRWDERGLCADPAVQRRRQELVSEAGVTLEAIRRSLVPPLAGQAPPWRGADDAQDPFTDPATLERAVTSGILDAPQLKNNPYGRGAVVTRIVGGACLAVDRDESRPWRGESRGTREGMPFSEAERLGMS